MRKRPPSRPTEAELSILRVIWSKGPSTVREVHEELLRDQDDLGYTTVLKLMQIMAEKDLLTRDESSRAHIYAARNPEQITQQQLIGHLVDRAFGGSASQLVLQALSNRGSSPRELEQIRRLIDELEGARK
ncbi:MAG: BlaI/MecI/CopY family transcriptional regulator [Acidobacteriota bacterium]